MPQCLAKEPGTRHPLHFSAFSRSIARGKQVLAFRHSAQNAFPAFESSWTMKDRLLIPARCDFLYEVRFAVMHDAPRKSSISVSPAGRGMA